MGAGLVDRAKVRRASLPGAHRYIGDNLFRCSVF